MPILKANLFERALVEPLESGCGELFVVSGYATPTMILRHAEIAKKINRQFDLKLIIGMVTRDGIDETHHDMLKRLHNLELGINVQCHYVVEGAPVHSKVYCWKRNGMPTLGFVGSANYTQSAFSTSMREVLVAHDSNACANYFDELLANTVPCVHPGIEDQIEITPANRFWPHTTHERQNQETVIVPELERVKLTLLDARTGQVPARSGLNWGQRPEYNREPNQAYINIPAAIGRSGFFPDPPTNFYVHTDDNKGLICVRAQQGGKGLHSTLNNSLLGEYFRNRLGLANGAFVETEDLTRYGRTDVDFYKIDEENFMLDFSVPD